MKEKPTFELPLYKAVSGREYEMYAGVTSGFPPNCLTVQNTLVVVAVITGSLSLHTDLDHLDLMGIPNLYRVHPTQATHEMIKCQKIKYVLYY